MQREGSVVRFHPVSQIGEGPQGGEVFVGMDEVLRRRVVVRKIATSSMSRESRTRLIIEARALCRLNHPNILQIYNYAEEDGYDVFTFEFAAGKKLSEVLGQLDFAEKVRIAVAVASALTVAHRNGIDHGALTSSSVLIAENGEVKLTDFASTSTTFDPRRSGPHIRIADESTVLSHTIDMHAFGMLLRELFGERDRDVRALILALLHEAPSERPTALEALTRLERLAARRGRRIRLAAIIVVAALFAVGAIKYTIDLQRGRREAIAARAAAEASRDRANELVAFMIKDIRLKLGHAGRLDIMDATSEKVLSHFKEMQPERMSASEASMNVQALAQVAGAQIARGRIAASRAFAQQALRIADVALARFPDDDDLRYAAATTHGIFSTALYRANDMNGALHHARVFADMMKEIVSRRPDHAEYVRNLASAHSNLGTLYDRREEIAASLREIELAIAVKRRALMLDDSEEGRFDVSVPIHKAGIALLKLGRLEEAKRTLELEHANLDALLARNRSHWRLRELVTVFDIDLVDVTLAMGDLDAAAKHSAAYLATAQQLTAFDAENVDWKRSLAEANRATGTVARMRGDLTSAMRHHTAAVELLSGVLAHGAQSSLLIRDLVISRIELARSLMASGRADAAATQTNLAIAALQPLQNERVGQRLMGDALLVQGEAREARGDRAGAVKSWEEALRVLAPLDELSPDPRIADAHARVLLRLGRTGAAQPLVEQLAALGYRNREFVALHETKGNFPGST